MAVNFSPVTTTVDVCVSDNNRFMVVAKFFQRSSIIEADFKFTVGIQIVVFI